MADSTDQNQTQAPEGASGTVANDQVKTEQNNVPTGGTVGPDPVTVQEEFRRAFNDIEAVMQRVEARLSFHEDVSALRDHLDGARTWLGEQLGLDKNEDGTFSAPGGTGADPSTVGQATPTTPNATNDNKSNA